MDPEKIKMKKIHNTAARHVTFSSRRRTLFKKARELAILCDVEVALIVFSSTGKLYDFSSISMKDIVEMYNRNLKDKAKAERSSSEFQAKSVSFESREEKLKEMGRQLRELHEKDVKRSALEELVQIEKTLEKRLCSVLERKGQKIMDEIKGLQQQGEELMEENALLGQKVMELTKGKREVDPSEPVQKSQKDPSFSGSVSCASTPGASRDIEDHSDTFLTLRCGSID